MPSFLAAGHRARRRRRRFGHQAIISMQRYRRLLPRRGGPTSQRREDMVLSSSLEILFFQAPSAHPLLSRPSFISRRSKHDEKFLPFNFSNTTFRPSTRRRHAHSNTPALSLGDAGRPVSSAGRLLPLARHITEEHFLSLISPIVDGRG